jgi:hypothetical protein
MHPIAKLIEIVRDVQHANRRLFEIRTGIRVDRTLR